VSEAIPSTVGGSGDGAKAHRRPGRVLRIAVLAVGLMVVAVLLLLLYQLIAKPAGPRTMAELKIANAEALVKKKPSDPAAQLELGSAYLEVGKDKEALEHLQLAASLAPTNWLTRYALANAYVVIGDTPAAIKEFEQAISVAPGNGALRYGLGELYMRQGDYKTGAKVLEGGVLVDPTAADTRALLGQAYERLGRRAEAAKQYREALRFSPGLQEATAGLARTGQSGKGSKGQGR